MQPCIHDDCKDYDKAITQNCIDCDGNSGYEPQPEADRPKQIPAVVRSGNFEKVGTDFDFIAINKETGEKVVVDLISMAKKQAYIKGKWGRIDAMNFSKRGKWELILQYK